VNQIKLIKAIAVGISLAVSLGSSVASAVDGAKLYRTKTCYTCHGDDAKTPILPVYPKLAGQNKEYIIAQMTDIKTGVRNNGNSAIMRGIMYLVNEKETEAIAQWLESLGTQPEETLELNRQP
jgi:cytochrome c